MTHTSTVLAALLVLIFTIIAISDLVANKFKQSNPSCHTSQELNDAVYRIEKHLNSNDMDGLVAFREAIQDAIRARKKTPQLHIVAQSEKNVVSIVRQERVS